MEQSRRLNQADCRVLAEQAMLSFAALADGPRTLTVVIPNLTKASA